MSNTTDFCLGFLLDRYSGIQSASRDDHGGDCKCFQCLLDILNMAMFSGDMVGSGPT